MICLRTRTRPLLLTTISALSALSAASLLAPDWPAWRGPTGDGQAAPGQTLPVKWSERENVLWKA